MGEIRIPRFMDFYREMLADLAREGRDVEAELERLDRFYDCAIEKVVSPDCATD